MNPRFWVLATLAGAACGTSGPSDQTSSAPAASTAKQSAQPASTASAPASSSAAPAAGKPQPTDEKAIKLISAATACELRDGKLSLDCPDLKAIGDYAFQNQGELGIAETCASFLRDADVKKRLLAAKCLDNFNAKTATTQLGPALDAIEAEQDPSVREEIAWGIKNAEAVTAKLDGRVLSIVKKLAADPKSERAASHLFGTLFPQYLIGEGPKPPPEAQKLAVESIARDGTPMQQTALNAVRLVDAQSEVCAALVKAMAPGTKRWGDAASAIADVGAPCVANVPAVIDLVLERAKEGDLYLPALHKLDDRFELDAATRKRVATTLKGARTKVREWERKGLDKIVEKYEKPRATK